MELTSSATAVVDQVIGVSGTEWIFDTKYPPSTFGDWADVSAPAPALSTTKVPSASTLYTLTGTSASAPHVAGLAALLLSEKPDLTSYQVEMIIKSSSKDLGNKGKDPVFGEGRIDARKAMLLVQPPVSIPDVEITSP